MASVLESALLCLGPGNGIDDDDEDAVDCCGTLVLLQDKNGHFAFKAP
jgi:hypothetical protein